MRGAHCYPLYGSDPTGRLARHPRCSACMLRTPDEPDSRPGGCLVVSEYILGDLLEDNIANQLNGRERKNGIEQVECYWSGVRTFRRTIAAAYCRV